MAVAEWRDPTWSNSPTRGFNVRMGFRMFARAMDAGVILMFLNPANQMPL